MKRKKYKLGFDVGGTFTDGVLISDDKVLYKAKSINTEDITTGIINSMDKVLDNTDITKEDVMMVSFGTTHTTNAIIERKNLNKVGIFRLAAPSTTGIPPLTGWPEDLIEVLGGKKYTYIINGGSEYNGNDIVELDENALIKACKEIKDNIDSIAVTSVFSPMIKKHENRAEKIIKNILGEDINITLSNKIASISILERENSTILNAAVIKVMDNAISALKRALEYRGIEAPLYVVQNDGTLMDSEYAKKYPIFTVASGPAASVRGASHLSGIQNGVVVDVGGTSTDIAYINNGFPRESSITVNIGGVKTNIRCPDLLSIALGGGTIIKNKDNKIISIGPESVGYNLTKEAISFGGKKLTTHDIAVASGIINKKLDIFDTNYVTDKENIKNLNRELVDDGYKKIKEILELSIDQMKTTSELIPAVFIGGGALVIPKKNIKGTSRVIEPENFEVGGAVGTTIAEVGAYAEGVVDLEKEDRDNAIKKVTEKAIDNLKLAGGSVENYEILDIEEVPFTYMPGKREKIRIKVKGKIK